MYGVTLAEVSRENFLDRYTRCMDVIARSGWEGEYIPLGAVSLPFLGHVSGDFTISSKRLGKKHQGDGFPDTEYLLSPQYFPAPTGESSGPFQGAPGETETAQLLCWSEGHSKEGCESEQWAGQRTLCAFPLAPAEPQDWPLQLQPLRASFPHSAPISHRALG